MDESKNTSAHRSVFQWATLSTEESIESYLIQCLATGGEDIIRDAQFLAKMAREELARQR